MFKPFIAIIYRLYTHD